MTSPLVEKLWYEAIFEEDCRGIRELLNPKMNLWLLKIGWKSDPKRLVGGSTWKGRTALHVGVRRGDVSLVKQVLRLCGLKVDEEKTADEKGAGSSSSIEGRESKHLLQGEGAEISSENSGERGGDKRKGKDADIPPSTECGKIEDTASSEGYLKSKRDSIQESESALNNYKARLENRASPDVLSSPKIRDDSNISDEEFKELLLSKDGQFELDVLAMAMLDGNVLIVALLVHALGHCADPPYGILRSDEISFSRSRIYAECISTKLPTQALDGKCGAQRALLRAVTIGVIEEFYSLEPAFMRACLTLYRTHLDFNFLPEEEYLFHFSWTARFEEVFDEEDKYAFRKLIWERIKDRICEEPDKQEKRKEQKKPAQEIEQMVLHFQGARSKPSELTTPLLATEEEEEQKKQEEQKQLWRFLLKLHDGQGRPPIHVAVDEGTEKSFLDLLGWRHSSGEDLDAISCALIARDGLGNTSIHRAAGITGKDSGRGRFWSSICKFTSEKCSQEVSLAFRSESEHPMISFCTQSTVRRDRLWFNLSELSEANGFRSGDCRSTPLQTSIIHNSYDIGVALFKVWRKAAWKMLYKFQLKPFRSVVSKEAPSLASIIHKNPDSKHVDAAFTSGLAAARMMLNNSRSSRSTAARDDLDKDSAVASGKAIALDVMELVCVVGADIEWVRLLLQGGYMEKDEGVLQPTLRILARLVDPFQETESRSGLWPTLHFLATYGNHETLECFLDSCEFDPLVEDEEENTALHRLMRDSFDKEFAFDTQNSASEETHVNTYRVEFKSHLLDYVSCNHRLMECVQSVGSEICEENFIADRKNCATLLLQAGCDVFKVNKHWEPPRPQGRLSSNEFMVWWYEKREEEFNAARDNLNNAANAISVAATLFATATYAGPIQPPRGYTIDSQVDLENPGVVIWYTLNLYSFHLSLIALTCSLMIILPLPKEERSSGLRRRRILLELAVLFLTPSIIGFCGAFVASSVTVTMFPSETTTSYVWILKAMMNLVWGGFWGLMVFSVLHHTYLLR